MSTTSLTKSLPALLALTGLAAAKAEAAHAAGSTQAADNTLETRIKNVRDRLNSREPGVSFAEKTTEDGLQTFWWGNWHNGGWGPGMWHNWGNGGWHNWHNWGNW